MKYIEEITAFRCEDRSAVTLGKFDGFHRGHQKLIGEIAALQKQGFWGIVFTIAPDRIPALLTLQEKRAVLEEYGIDCMIRCPFVPEILGMEPEAFISDILVDGLNAKHIVVGTDFRFGHNRAGDVEMLAALQKKYNYTLKVVKKERCRGREISSTYVKEALRAADMALANRLLGYEYPVHGTVEHGRQLGRRIGMPTINIIPEKYKLLPPQGVYFSTAATESGRFYGVTNIGYKPTVDGSFLGVETYLYGTEEDMYGQPAEIRLLKFCRPERKFATVEELKSQMELDILAGKEFFHVS